MTEPPWERVFICNSVHKSQRIDAVNNGGRAAHCQSHPIIPARSCYPPPPPPRRIRLRPHTCVRFYTPPLTSSHFSLYFQATRSRPACRRAASAGALAPPCARAVTTSWTVEGKDSPPFQPTCQRAWPRCKHRACGTKNSSGYHFGLINQDLGTIVVISLPPCCNRATVCTLCLTNIPLNDLIHMQSL